MNLWTNLAAFSFIEMEHLFLRPIIFEDAEANLTDRKSVV